MCLNTLILAFYATIIIKNMFDFLWHKLLFESIEELYLYSLIFQEDFTSLVQKFRATNVHFHKQSHKNVPKTSFFEIATQ